MANKSWEALRASIEDWHAARVEKALKKVRGDAEQVRADIISELRSSGEGKTPNASALSAKTRITSEAKAKLLSPKNRRKEAKDPLSGLELYTDAIIIEAEGSGANTIQVVKVDDLRKKDETTGMSLDKIAKAIEFGTTRSAPRPAWRRSLKKVGATGVYKKKTT